MTKRILAVVLVMIFALALTACSKESIEGDWTVTGGTAIEAITGADYEALNSGLKIVFSFPENKTFSILVEYMGTTVCESGIWEANDGELAITAFGDNYISMLATYEIRGDKLSLTFPEGTIDLEKRN